MKRSFSFALSELGSQKKHRFAILFSKFGFDLVDHNSDFITIPKRRTGSTTWPWWNEREAFFSTTSLYPGRRSDTVVHFIQLQFKFVHATGLLADLLFDREHSRRAQRTKIYAQLYASTSLFALLRSSSLQPPSISRSRCPPPRIKSYIINYYINMI